MTTNSRLPVIVRWRPRNRKSVVAYKLLLEDSPLVAVDISVGIWKSDAGEYVVTVKILEPTNPASKFLYGTQGTKQFRGNLPATLLDEKLSVESSRSFLELLSRIGAVGQLSPPESLLSIIVWELAKYRPSVTWEFSRHLQSTTPNSSQSGGWEAREKEISNLPLSLSEVTRDWSLRIDNDVSAHLIGNSTHLHVLRDALGCWDSSGVTSLLPQATTDFVSRLAAEIKEELEATREELLPKGAIQTRPMVEPGADFNWGAVRFHFLGDLRRIQVILRGKPRTFNLKTLGLSVGRYGDRLNLQGKTLLKFAGYQHISARQIYEKESMEIPLGSPEEATLRTKARKLISSLRKTLKGIFRVDDDPFYPRRRSDGWKPRFTVTFEQANRDFSRFDDPDH